MFIAAIFIITKKWKQLKFYKAIVLCVLSHSVMSSSLQPYGLQPGRLFCPCRFSRQEYWSGLPCPPLGDLPNPEIKVRSPTLQVDPLPTESCKYKTECYPATRRTEVLTWASLVAQSTHVTLCMNLKNTTQCLKPLTKDNVSYDCSYMKSPESANLIEQIDQQLLRMEFGRKWSMTANGYRVSLWGDENILKFIVVMVV